MSAFLLAPDPDAICAAGCDGGRKSNVIFAGAFAKNNKNFLFALNV
jgi:hypothetical protein